MEGWSVPVAEGARFAEDTPVATLDAVLADLRPALQADGGDLTVHGFDDDGVLHLGLLGACGTCPLLMVTLVAGIEQYVQLKVPGVAGVVAALPDLAAPTSGR